MEEGLNTAAYPLTDENMSSKAANNISAKLPATSDENNSQTQQSEASSVAKTGLEAPPPSLEGRFRTTDVTGSKQIRFEEFNLTKELLYGIYDKGYTHCSPVQEKAIPIILSGLDIVARAKNGTGKTAAYAIPLLQKINLLSNDIQAVVLVPARELAMQTSLVIKEIGQYLEASTGSGDKVNKKKLQCMIATGGTSVKEDVLRIGQKVHVVVATLGRLFDLVEKNVANLENCNLLVLDEADKLLSSEFEESCESIISHLPINRQILMFSATFPETVRGFRMKHMPNAKEVNLMQELVSIYNIILRRYTYIYKYIYIQ